MDGMTMHPREDCKVRLLNDCPILRTCACCGRMLGSVSGRHSHEHTCDGDYSLAFANERHEHRRVFHRNGLQRKRR